LSRAVTAVRDYGPDNRHTEVWLGHLYDRDDRSSFEVAIVVHDDDVDHVVSAIVSAARTKHHADGHVVVMPVNHRYNIHTGQRETC
jgi:nitrogen regulatory protein PII